MVLQKLKSLEDEAAKLTQDLEKKLLDASREYDRVCKNLYDQRASSVGNHGGGEEEEDEDEEATSSKGIPGFWSSVFQRDNKMVDWMGPEDEEILTYLKDARVATFTEGEGYTIRLSFRPNPFFSNPVLERSDTIAATTLAGKPLRFSVAKATRIEWTQPPTGGKQRKKGGKGGKGGKKAAHGEEEKGGEAEEGGGHVQLRYGQSVFALFNPPNLGDLVPAGTRAEATGALLEAAIAKGDARFGRTQQAILEDRAVAKHVWLDLVPRAALHFSMCAELPAYECPLGLGLNRAAERRLEGALKAQRALDERRADLAERFRALRAEAQARLDALRAARRDALAAAPPDAPTRLFWLTAIRNCHELWSAVTDRDELALRFLTDVTWRYKAAAGQEGGAGAEDTDFLMAPQRRAFDPTPLSY